MAHKTEPLELFSENIYHFTPAELERTGIKLLAEHLSEAVEAFTKDNMVLEALGGYISKYLVELKTRELKKYTRLTGRD